ncbi:threonine/serine ThrE exporter family protein [Campylobacter ureolyticus]|uniref:threonine/serine ThrE exporter family protein n=1 Tax=Campylobacter ureolyticus TaxID=827 RepID=UPI0022B48525|nr:threonine/serine exporter family protein [Campylobacter ureolyticus]MCZ6168958.1 threonine/serine exporter family protein [Campylobacter ureolyticus]
MKPEINELTNFLADYADTLSGVGAYNARVIRCVKRIASHYGYNASIFILIKFINLTVSSKANPEIRKSFIKDATQKEINLETISDLSALSWAVSDEDLSLKEAKDIYQKIIAKKKRNILITFALTSIAFGAFCRLFGGDIFGVVFVIFGTFCGVLSKFLLSLKKVDIRITYIFCAFISSFIAYLGYKFGFSKTPEASISSSILYLFPGIALINSMFDILDKNVLIGLSRGVNATILILCMSIGIYITLSLVNFGLIK